MNLPRSIASRPISGLKQSVSEQPEVGSIRELRQSTGLTAMPLAAPADVMCEAVRPWENAAIQLLPLVFRLIHLLDYSSLVGLHPGSRRLLRQYFSLEGYNL